VYDAYTLGINLRVQDPGAREAGNGMTFLMLLDEAAERARWGPGTATLATSFTTS